MPDEKLTISQFAAKIKAKHPEYKSVNDTLLTQRMIAKYPEYKDSVDYSPVVLGEDPTPKGGNPIDRIPKLDFTKIPQEKKQVDVVSVGVPKFVEKPLTGKIMHEVRQEEVANSRNKIVKVLNKSDNAVAGIIYVDELAEVKKNYADAQANNGDIKGIITPTLNHAPEVIEQKKQELIKDDIGRAKIIDATIKAHPEKAKELKSDWYLHIAEQTLADGEDPTGRTTKILANAKKLKNGDLDLDIHTGQLIKKINPIDSFSEGVLEKKDLFEKYDSFMKNDAATNIKKLNHSRDNYDIDEPMKVADGVLSEMSHSLGATPIRGLAIGAATNVIPGVGQALSPFVTAAMSSVDYYQMTYAAELERTYHELKDAGMSDEEAYAKAKEQAEYAGTVDAASGAAMMAVGSRIPVVKKAPLTGGFQKAAVNFIKNNSKEGIIKFGEAAGIGLAMGESQRLKNINANEVGADRDEDEGAAEARKAGFFLTIGMYALTKSLHGGGKGIKNILKSEEKSLLLGAAKADPLSVDAALGELILQNKITEQEAQTVKDAVEGFKKETAGIPDNVTESAALKIKDKIAKRTELERKLENIDKAFHAELKERIKAIDEEIVALSKEKEEKPELSENRLAIQKAVSDGKLNDIQKIMAESDPDGFMKGVADQALGRSGDGKTEYSLDAEQATRDTYGNDLVDAAIKQFPLEKKQASSVSVIKPEEISRPENIALVKSETITPKTNEGVAENVSEQTTPSSFVDEVVPENITEEAPVVNPQEPDMIGITHQQTSEVAKQLGFDAYEKSPETTAQWDAEAKERFAKDPDAMNKLVNKMRRGEMPDNVEQRMSAMYLADLKAKYEKSPTPEMLNQINRFVKLSDIVGGREVAKSLRARQNSLPVEETLADYHLRDIEYNNDAPLTERQMAQSTKEYNEINRVKSEFQAKVEKLEAENAKLKAQKEISKVKSSSPKTKRTHEDYAKERSSYIEELKKQKAAHVEKMKSMGIQQQGGIAGIVLTPEMAKTIAKIVKSYVEEGVDKLEAVVKSVHGDLKDIFEGISEKDIHNVIAGEYAEKKKTRSDVLTKMVDLRTEAGLVNKLEKLIAGEQPKSEKQKIKRNQQIEDLRSKIKQLQKEEKEANAFHGEEISDEGKRLRAYKAKLEKKMDEVEAELKSGNFAPKKKVEPLKLDKEAQKLQDEFIKLKQDRELRLIKQKYANRTKSQKFRDNALEVLNVPRTLQSSGDLSAVLRQGLVAVTGHPIIASKASVEMIKQMWSQKRFDRWFHQLKEHPRYKLMQDSKLSIADPHDYRLSSKEEAFMNNLAEKIPFFGGPIKISSKVPIIGGKKIGGLVKGSERAYVSFLNKMRVDLFNMYADRFMEAGKTFENNPELYKAIASHIGNITGRGNIGKLEVAAPILNTMFFSPRLIASRMNLLTNWANPKFYKEVPKEVRVEYFKDMFKFMAMGMTVLGLAKINGADVEDDPRSADFGKIREGNTRWDIWGGFQQYIKFFAQVASGERKSSNTGKVQQLDGEGAFGTTRADLLGSFARGKLAPVPSMTLDFLSGRTIMGEKILWKFGGEHREKEITLLDVAGNRFLPLMIGDIYDAYKDKGVKALFTVGVPVTLGVGSQTYEKKK